MRLLVCGGRHFGDTLEERECIRATLDDIANQYIIDMVVTGDATGTDRVALVWAKFRELPFRKFVADWHSRGPAAGPLRNQRMLDVGKPSLVIAFPGGRGTADMVRRARAAGVRVIEVAR